MNKKRILQIGIPLAFIGYLIYRYYNKVYDYYTIKKGQTLNIFLEPDSSSSVVYSYDGRKLPTLIYMGLKKGNYITVFDNNSISRFGWVKKSELIPYLEEDWEFIEGGFKPCSENCDNECGNGYTFIKGIIPKSLLKPMPNWDIYIDTEKLMPDAKMCATSIYSEPSKDSNKIGTIGFGETRYIQERLKKLDGLWLKLGVNPRSVDEGKVIGWVKASEIRPSYYSH